MGIEVLDNKTLAAAEGDDALCNPDWVFLSCGSGEVFDDVVAPEFLGAVDRMGPERIVYISCNPETQRRDLRLLAGWGWRARLLQPVDLFPHTEHVECVAVLAKIRGGGM